MRRRWFSNLGIRYKLFASYVVVIAIPFLLLLVLHIDMTERENKEAAVYASHKMLDETKSYLEYKAQAITEVLNFIAFNSIVQTGVIADSEQYEDVNLWHKDALQLSQLVNQFRYNKDIDTIQIYMEQGLAGATETPEFVNMNNVALEAWFRDFTASRASFAWLPSSLLGGDASSRELSILRKVPDAHNIHQFDGIIRARVNQGAMQSVLNHAVLTPNAAAVLVNDDGDILSQSDQFPYGTSLVMNIHQAFLQADGQESWYNDNYMIGGKRHLLGVQAIPDTNMEVALIVPYSDILQSSTKARNRIISIFLLVVPFMLPLSFFVAGSATKRIRQLILHVRKIKHGNFQVAPLPTSEDEIGELTRHFNIMVHNISGLLDETYTLGREVKNKELLALQAQINPHFLYNTLDLINVMAIETGSRDIKRVVDELAVFYKLSLSNGKEYVTFENELQHVEAYVRIQNMRFGGCIRLELEVSRELYPCIVPKILLQPLVENAILHGIMEKDDEEGTIRISAWTDQGELVIEVSDDGVGMDEEQVLSILTRPSTSIGGGYGVRNIEERLKLAFGVQYGLKFESSPGIGTRVMLHLPVHTAEER